MMERDLNDAGRGDHATFRELKGVEDALQRRMGAIELQQASQAAALMHLPDDVRQLTAAVNNLSTKVHTAPAPMPQHDSLGLAVTRLADELAKERQDRARQPTPAAELVQVLKNRPSGLPWLLTGGIGALALMLGWQIFTGG